MKDQKDLQTLSANIANAATKIVFAMREPADAEYLARVLFLGFIDYAEYKQGTERPLVVGHHKEIVRNRSTAQHAAKHEAVGETASVAVGTAQTHMLSRTEAEGESVTDASSQATALGSTTSEGSGTAASSFDGTSNSASMDPNSVGMFLPPTITSLGSAASAGTGMTDIASRSLGSSTTDISGSSHAVSTTRMSAVTEGFAATHSEVHGYAKSRMRGTSKGLSDSAGVAETFVATLEWLPSELYSAHEQLERLTGELMNLAPRECFIKVGSARPVRTRTADLEPGFRSDYCRRALMPAFEQALARSPYLRPAAEIDAELAARTTLPPPQPEPNLSRPEPVQLPDDAHGFAQDFFKRNPHAKHLPFDVIPGGKDAGDKDKD
jgi:hypothetical protein